MNAKYITKDYSAAVITHAIAKAEFLGEKQKDIAKYLGIDDSNIGRYVRQKQNLSPNAVKLLTEKYGFPRQASGRYLEPTLYKDVSDYIDSLESRDMENQAALVARLFSSKKVKLALASTVTPKVLEKPKKDDEDTFSFISNVKGCSPGKVDAVISWLNDAVKGETFKQWYQDMLEWSLGEHPFHDLSKLPQLKHNEWGNTLISGKEHILYFLMADFYFNFEEYFSLPHSGTITSDILHAEPVTLTGDTLITFSSSDINMKTLPSFRKLKKHITCPDRMVHEASYEVANIELYDYLKDICTYSLNNVECQLVMNNNMVYRLFITEDWGAFKTDIVVTDIPQNQVFDVYETLRERFNFETNTEYEMKCKIAKAGGFIPGARVL